MIKIAIDAMGGDFGPEPIIEGVVMALEEQQFLPILVGDKEEILSLLPQYYANKVEIVESSDVIDMADQATNALKRKDSSIYKAVELVRNKEADAVVSAGHSGATMTLATLRMAFKLLQNLRGFVGNVEGKDIFNGNVDVVVCDGFTGNILLKTSEGVVTTVFALMKQYIRKSLPAKIGALMMRKKVFVNMKKEVDKDEYGGAPLLGVNGCAIISESGVNNEIEALLTQKA